MAITDVRTNGVCTKPKPKPKPTPTRKPKPAPKGLCGNKRCPPHPDHGFFHCIQGKKCLLSCSAGWQPKSNAVCVNIHNDVKYCGSTGRRCPGSYNGVGKAICTAGRCSLSCPRGSSIKKRGSSLYCTTR
ncbi:BQ2448_363 [Microbotryum intermedium]|uniref:BQ2448_363 protein n=1 Tax=Microbotryum intermedium TaxID=269621 RepID=A0A238F285_9BASI|nr:BQ2448_363 [Microbotryum intermedium]